MEIEVKAKVEDLDNLAKKLEEVGCIFSEPIIQDDYIFNQKGINLKDNNHNTPVLRIREENAKILFTLKKNRSNELDCVEKETEVSNGDILREIIELLGFEETVRVHKKRRRGKYEDYEICLDVVEGLGSFIEVEKMSDKEGEEVQKELFDFLKKFGVSEEDRIFIGYDTALWMKKNL